MSSLEFLNVANELEEAGLVWCPEIGDEVAVRIKPRMVSILVDPQGMSPTELRSTYLWLPTLEQMVNQVEARQAVLFHLGIELSKTSLVYKAILKRCDRAIESVGDNLRTALGLALRDLIAERSPSSNLH